MSATRLIFLAGPNGAGKSTFYEQFLAHLGLPFVNADRITAKLDISNAEAAAAADRIRDELLKADISFVTETVFSDAVGAKLRFLRDALAAGYEVSLIYIGLDSVELSAARVASRVQEGGHDVPPDRLARRFGQSIRNLGAALQFVPAVYVYDNSARDEPYRLVMESVAGRTKLHPPLPGWLKHVAK